MAPSLEKSAYQYYTRRLHPIICLIGFAFVAALYRHTGRPLDYFSSVFPAFLLFWMVAALAVWSSTSREHRPESLDHLHPASKNGRLFLLLLIATFFIAIMAAFQLGRLLAKVSFGVSIEQFELGGVAVGVSIAVPWLSLMLSISIDAFRLFDRQAASFKDHSGQSHSNCSPTHQP